MDTPTNGTYLFQFLVTLDVDPTNYVPTLAVYNQYSAALTTTLKVQLIYKHI